MARLGRFLGARFGMSVLKSGLPARLGGASQTFGTPPAAQRQTTPMATDTAVEEVTITFPTDPIEDSVLVAFVAVSDDTDDHAAPAGWTKLSHHAHSDIPITLGVSTWWKAAAVGESDEATFTWTGAGLVLAAGIEVIKADTALPEASEDATAEGAAASSDVEVASVTTTEDLALLVGFAAQVVAQTGYASDDSEFVLRQTQLGVGISGYLGTEFLGDAGATTARNVTSTLPGAWVTSAVAVKP